MFRGLFLTSVATVTMSAALFSRKDKAGWLDELDGIRDDALLSPTGDTAAVMGEVASLAETGIDSAPIQWDDSDALSSELEAWRAAAAADEPADDGRLPVPVAAVGSQIDDGEPREQPVAAIPPAPSGALPAPPPLPPSAWASLPPPPDAVESSPEPAPTSTAPAPHRAYPAEMWHPDIVLPAEPESVVADAPEQLLGPADLLEEASEPPRFRFASLRTVEPFPIHGEREAASPPPAPADPAPAPALPTRLPAVREVVRPATDTYQVSSPRSIAPPPPARTSGVDGPVEATPVVARTVEVGSADAITFLSEAPLTPLVEPVVEPSAPDWTTPPDVPLVPEPEPGVGGALITGPVARRPRRGEDHREVAPDRSITLPAGLQVIGDVDVDRPGDRTFPVADDGTVNLGAGLLRLGPEVGSEVRHDSGRVRVALATSWCWVTLGLEADPVTVLLPGGSVALAAGTTALVSVEDDGTTFIVVANGNGVLVEPNGSTILPGSSVALVPLGSPPQVDQASASEIAAEPLVARNRALDAGV